MNTSEFPQIVIIGAGAVCSLLGGLFAKNGHNVLLIGRSDHVASINGSGLQIDGVSGKLTLPVKAATSLKCRPDIVFLTVKSQDVETACREIAPLVNDVPVCTQALLQSCAATLKTCLYSPLPNDLTSRTFTFESYAKKSFSIEFFAIITVMSSFMLFLIFTLLLTLSGSTGFVFITTIPAWRDCDPSGVLNS